MYRLIFPITALVFMLFSCQDPDIHSNLQKVVEYSEDSILCATYYMDDSNRIQGIFSVTDMDGHLVLEKNYVDGLLNGSEKNYYTNGQLEGEYHLKDGLYEGAYKTYSEEGHVLSEGNYKENMIDGELRTYYDNEQLKEVVTMQHNMTNGPFKEFDEEGLLVAEGSYVYDGEKDGLEDGLLLLYENNQLVKQMICDTGLCCTTWTLEKGDISPVNDLCKGIIQRRKPIK